MGQSKKNTATHLVPLALLAAGVLGVGAEEKEYYDDLSTELELADDDDPPTLYKIGESFFHLPLRDARRQLKKDMKRYETDIEGLEARAEECEKGMKELKVHLYAKFGKQINLETTP
ncbi:hypothetical protein B9479_005820 [Cryptococcus floricola]|uniref:Prefoldin subunit 4 n=1 Tax=Cryptococcus floricola TaxID=2591691 RepID=A0A5D3ATL3_9TREE|nr:hypothetical protein B9479_005820 [Cryptococcus floricola]